MCYIPKSDDISTDNWNKYWTDWDNEFTIKNELQSKAIKELGYELITHTPFKYEYLGPDGNIYIGAEAYQEKFKYVPGLRNKDGVWYGYYEVIKKHNLEFEMTTKLENYK